MIQTEKESTQKICPIMTSGQDMIICAGAMCRLWEPTPSKFQTTEIKCAICHGEGCEDCDYTGNKLEEIKRGYCGLGPKPEKEGW